MPVTRRPGPEPTPWSNGKPAYRCRHGHASAARSDPARPKNTYIREDQILPHLAAVAILHGDHALPNGSMQVVAPSEVAALIDQLRTADITLTYEPDTQTLRTSSDSNIATVAVS